MYSERPIIQITASTLQKRVEAFCVALLLFLCLGSLYLFTDLPPTIPTHFNVAGRVDGYGSRSTFFILPIIGILFYWLISFLQKKPHWHNYLQKVTSHNATYLYTRSINLLQWIKLFVLLLLTSIQICIRVSISNKNIALPIIMVSAISTLVLPIVTVVYITKKPKTT